MLGGFASPKALADELGLERFGDRTIREVETDGRGLRDYEAAAVAHACGISPSFFTIDLSALDDPASPAAALDALELLVARVDQVRGRVEEQRQPQQASTGPGDGAPGGGAA